MAFSIKHGSRLGIKLAEGEEPKKNLESEGNKYIKDQVQKQIKTELTLEEALNQKKEFTTGMGYVRLETGGKNTLTEFKGILNSVSRKEDLTSNINKKCSGGMIKTVTRDEFEAAMAVKPGSIETELLKITMKCNIKNDPTLNRLNKNLQANPRALAKTIRRKRKQQLEEAEQKAPQKIATRNGSDSLWDVEEIVEEKAIPKRTCSEGPLQCQANWDLGFTFVMANDTQNIALGKMSDEDIRLLPGFGDYTRGTPSKGLFLKNLPKSVTETYMGTILAAALKESNLCSEGVTLRLLRGRMRGQAFIQTHDVSDATKLLELMNGTILGRKSIVVQYSKKST